MNATTLTNNNNFAEWHPVSWTWTSPGGICFTIGVITDIVDGNTVEAFGLWASGCAIGKFSTMENAKEKAAQIVNEVTT